MKRSRAAGLVILIASLIFVNTLSAKEPEKIKKEVIIRRVSGRVSGISANFIAVEYAVDSSAAHEIALTMDKDTRGVKKELNKIGTGDTVAVTYDEMIETGKDNIPKVKKRLVKTVEFVKAAAEPASDLATYDVVVKRKGKAPFIKKRVLRSVENQTTTEGQ